MRLLTLLSMLLAAIGCDYSSQPAKTLTLATTTSTRDSGLLDVLIPMFEQQTGVAVKVVAVGSGQALEMGRRGDADVLLTHAPQAEEQFVAGGHGLARRLVMSNDFVLVGPKSDPAKIQGEPSIQAAFAQIAENKSPLVSRGDESGTHIKEQSIWRQAELEPHGPWYIQAGAGMAQTLRMASEKEAYTLSDRGTFLAQNRGLELVILSEGDPLLKNQYAVIIVSPQKHPHVQAGAAQQFEEFLLEPETQATIREFGREKYGQPLFFPQEEDSQTSRQIKDDDAEPSVAQQHARS